MSLRDSCGECKRGERYVESGVEGIAVCILIVFM